MSGSPPTKCPISRKSSAAASSLREEKCVCLPLPAGGKQDYRAVWWWLSAGTCRRRRCSSLRPGGEVSAVIGAINMEVSKYHFTDEVEYEIHKIHTKEAPIYFYRPRSREIIYLVASIRPGLAKGNQLAFRVSLARRRSMFNSNIIYPPAPVVEGMANTLKSSIMQIILTM